MAYYTNSITTEVVNPQFNQSKYRSTFQLSENALYSPFLRVLNLGVVATTASFNESRRYNKLCGATGSIIKNIFLYDGTTVLDQVLNYVDYGAFRQYNNTNNANMDVKKNLTKTGLGFVLNNEFFNTGDTLFNIQSRIKEVNPVNGGHIPSTSSDTTPTSYLDLREVFPLLRSLEFLSTTIFKKLRVVIEYDVKNTLTITDGNLDLPTETTVPILVADKITDEEFSKKWTSSFKGVVWNAIETENVILPALVAAPSNGVQTQKFRLNGFSNNVVNVHSCLPYPSSNTSTATL
jgi:hypothetical protein